MKPNKIEITPARNNSKVSMCNFIIYGTTSEDLHTARVGMIDYSTLKELIGVNFHTINIFLDKEPYMGVYSWYTKRVTLEDIVTQKITDALLRDKDK